VLTSFILKNKSKQKEISYCQPNSEKICRTFDDGEKKEIHKSASRHIPNVQHQLEKNTVKLDYRKLFKSNLTAVKKKNSRHFFSDKSMYTTLTNLVITNSGYNK
jgi:glutaredoxin 2